MTGRAVSCSKSARGHLAERAAAVFRLFGRILLARPSAQSCQPRRRRAQRPPSALSRKLTPQNASGSRDRKRFPTTSTYFAARPLTYCVFFDYGVSDRLALHEAIVHLRQLAALPETSDTPAQIETAHRDLVSLNRFFDTKRLYE